MQYEKIYKFWDLLNIKFNSVIKSLMFLKINFM